MKKLSLSLLALATAMSFSTHAQNLDFSSTVTGSTSYGTRDTSIALKDLQQQANALRSQIKDTNKALSQDDLQESFNEWQTFLSDPEVKQLGIGVAAVIAKQRGLDILGNSAHSAYLLHSFWNVRSDASNIFKQGLKAISPKKYKHLIALTPQNATKLLELESALDIYQRHLEKLNTETIVPLLNQQRNAFTSTYLLGSQYAELQFNQQLLNKSLSRVNGLYFDAVGDHLRNNFMTISQPNFVLGYQGNLTSRLQLGSFVSYSAKNKAISQNYSLYNNDKAYGVGFYGNYQYNKVNLSVLTNLIAHSEMTGGIDEVKLAQGNQSFTQTKETATHRGISYNLSVKAGYKYQPNESWSFTPAFNYQFGLKGRVNTMTDGGTRYTLDASRTQVAGLSLLSQYHRDNWKLGLDLGVDQVVGNGAGYSTIGINKEEITINQAHEGIYPNGKPYVLTTAGLITYHRLSEYRFGGRLSAETAVRNTHIGAFVGYNYYTETKFHGAFWGINIKQTF